MVTSNEDLSHEIFELLAKQARDYEEKLQELSSKKRRVSGLQFELARRLKEVIQPVLNVLGPSWELNLGRNWVLTGSGFALRTETGRTFRSPNCDQIDAEFLQPLREQLFELSEEVKRRTAETEGLIGVIDPVLADLEPWGKVLGIEMES